MSAEDHHSIRDDQAIDLIVQHLQTLFPRSCSNCRQHFATLHDFFVHTSPVGPVVSFDLETGETRPAEPIGTVAMSNCRCGTTLALTSEGMPRAHLWRVLRWATETAKSRGLSAADFIQFARRETRRRVLGDRGDESPG